MSEKVYVKTINHFKIQKSERNFVHHNEDDKIFHQNTAWWKVLKNLKLHFGFVLHWSDKTQGCISLKWLHLCKSIRWVQQKE